jgi:hypothetical protein
MEEKKKCLHEKHMVNAYWTGMNCIECGKFFPEEYFVLKSHLTEKDKEISRLTGLIDKALDYAFEEGAECQRRDRYTVSLPDDNWEYEKNKWKKQNNL